MRQVGTRKTSESEPLTTRRNNEMASKPGSTRVSGMSLADTHFPTEQAALKCIYLALMSLDPTGTGRKRWSAPLPSRILT